MLPPVAMVASEITSPRINYIGVNTQYVYTECLNCVHLIVSFFRIQPTLQLPVTINLTRFELGRWAFGRISNRIKSFTLHELYFRYDTIGQIHVIAADVMILGVRCLFNFAQLLTVC